MLKLFPSENTSITFCSSIKTYTEKIKQTNNSLYQGNQSEVDFCKQFKEKQEHFQLKKMNFKILKT